MKIRWTLFLGAALAWASVVSAARAQSEADVAEARRIFEEAEGLFGEGNYALSLEGFERSHALMEGHPRQYLIVFNIGRCQEELGRVADAIETFERYLREGGSTFTNGEETRRRVRELRLRLEASAPEGPSGLLVASISLGGLGDAACWDLTIAGSDIVCVGGTVGGDFLDGTLPFGGGLYDAVVASFHRSDGILTFALSLGSIDDDTATSVAMSSDGSLLVGGSFGDTVLFGAESGTARGRRDGYLIRIRPTP